MKTYLVLVLISFIFSYLIGNRYKLFDYPSSRKIHNFPVLNIGGMGIILSLIFSIYLFDYSFNLNQIILFSFLLTNDADHKIYSTKTLNFQKAMSKSKCSLKFDLQTLFLLCFSFEKVKISKMLCSS